MFLIHIGDRVINFDSVAKLNWKSDYLFHLSINKLILFIVCFFMLGRSRILRGFLNHYFYFLISWKAKNGTCCFSIFNFFFFCDWTDRYFFEFFYSTFGCFRYSSRLVWWFSSRSSESVAQNFRFRLSELSNWIQ